MKEMLLVGTPHPTCVTAFRMERSSCAVADCRQGMPLLCNMQQTAPGGTGRRGRAPLRTPPCACTSCTLPGPAQIDDQPVNNTAVLQDLQPAGLPPAGLHLTQAITTRRLKKVKRHELGVKSAPALCSCPPRFCSQIQRSTQCHLVAAWANLSKNAPPWCWRYTMLRLPKLPHAKLGPCGC